MTYMFSHVLKTSLPFSNIEICVAKPRVAISVAAAPCPLGHVIVQMYVDLLLVAFRRDGIEDLYKR